MDILALSKLGRFRDIVGVLFKYGFDDVAERLQFPGKILHKQDPHKKLWT